MFEYFQTTGLIIVWTVFLSYLTAIVAYVLTRKSKIIARWVDVLLVHQPALSLGVLAIFLSYKLFDLNLLFPVHLLTRWEELVLSAIVPAIILNLASGLTLNIFKTTDQQYNYWRDKTFFQTRRALGLDPTLGIRRLVIIKSLSSSWASSITWVFGELLIIESVFNAPGLGLAIWHQARTREMNAMLVTALWFFLIYFTIYLLNLLLHSWLGKKLEGYS